MHDTKIVKNKIVGINVLLMKAGTPYIFPLQIQSCDYDVPTSKRCAALHAPSGSARTRQ